MSTSKWKCSSVEDLGRVAKEILASAPTRLFAFYGEMGSGKTTLIKAICFELGVEETMGSPTFSIVNEYRAGSDTIFHFDVYRIKQQEELYDIGYEEYFYSGEYVFVEWAEKIPDLISPDFAKVNITLLPDTSREIILEAPDQ